MNNIITTPDSRTYSPFWPLQIFFTVLSLWMIYQLVGLIYQQANVQGAIGQLMPQAQGADQVNKRLVSFVQDLNTTSVQDPGAAQILAEFKIQIQAPPATNAASPAATK